eukprot:TRINITY_DN2002_c0_g1_i1.p1 TRINITY_DN2002_c0_g1~~TRINITY_DN2002_c0_g1_i1.p1  ORF type:complete len:502 (-),score=142.02 TRINITY_DN2002_c0_g1_i1:282-1787(-)
MEGQTLVDKFLEDFDQEDEDDFGQDEHGEDGEDGEDEDDMNEMEVKEEEDADEDEEEEDELVEIDALKQDTVKAIAKIRQSAKFQNLFKSIEAFMSADSLKSIVGRIEDHPEYKCIVDGNNMVAGIDDEILLIHKFVRDHYSKKFPELETLVLNPMDYVRVVKKIGNEMDLTKVDLVGLLNSATIMIVTVTASTTTGQPLPEDTLAKAVEGCDEAIALEECKNKILSYVESRMSYIAPNVSQIVGCPIAAKLMGIAGGLISLSKIPACNILVLGAKKKALSGFSLAASRPHAGLIFNCEIMASTPESLKTKAGRVIAAKCALAARVDSFREAADGTVGKQLREEILKKIEKWQEPPPGKQIKPLAAPDDRPKKRRGGRKFRKMKEKYGLTELRKAANRMVFGLEEDTVGVTGIGIGMAGSSMSNKLKIQSSDKLSKAIAKAAMKKQKQRTSSGATGGLTSSMVFTQTQSLEFPMPEAAPRASVGKYFSPTAGFSNIQPKSS